jgi:hypothetical protein
MAPPLDHFQLPQEAWTRVHRKYPPSEDMVVAAEEDDDVREVDHVIKSHYDQLRECIPNGCRLFRRFNAQQGRRYFHTLRRVDEIEHGQAI